MDHIITYPQRIGATDYLTADKIDIDAHLKAGTLNERLVFLMREQSKVAEASPEAFCIAVARRPPDAPWPPRGFTEAYLLEKGLITKDEIPGAPPKPAPKPKQPPKAEAKRVTHVTLTDAKVPVGNYYLQPRPKRGNLPPFWDAVDHAGRLLHDKAFRTEALGREFLESLSTERPAADSPEDESQAETADGGDLQSEPAGGEGQDPPADR